ncbi:MAG: Sec-independent protein translocase subunit TatA/TatB [Actinomycetota bacterium]
MSVAGEAPGRKPGGRIAWGGGPTRHMLNIGPQELILILIVALVVVGPQRLPELGRTIGKVLREFRKIQDDVKDTIKFDLDDEPEPYVRPRRSPRAHIPEESVGVSAKDTPTPTATPTPTDAPTPDGSAMPDDNGHLGTDGSPETEIDPEPRAAE